MNKIVLLLLITLPLVACFPQSSSNQESASVDNATENITNELVVADKYKPVKLQNSGIATRESEEITEQPVDVQGGLV